MTGRATLWHHDTMKSRDPLDNSLEGLISVEQAAAILGKSAATVRRIIARGELHPWNRLGRVLVSQPEVEKLKRKRLDGSTG